MENNTIVGPFPLAEVYWVQWTMQYFGLLYVWASEILICLSTPWWRLSDFRGCLRSGSEEGVKKKEDDIFVG